MGESRTGAAYALGIAGLVLVAGGAAGALAYRRRR
jgi:LPXTG-motif cell wall-anchored protein